MAVGFFFIYFFALDMLDTDFDNSPPPTFWLKESDFLAYIVTNQ